MKVRNGPKPKMASPASEQVSDPSVLYLKGRAHAGSTTSVARPAKQDETTQIVDSAPSTAREKEQPQRRQRVVRDSIKHGKPPLFNV